MAIQSSVSASLVAGRRGQLHRADGAQIESRFVDEANGFDEGYFVAPGTDAETEVSKLGALPSADSDGFSAATALGTSDTTVAFDGALAGLQLSPPQFVRVTTNSHADWDVGTLTVKYINDAGNHVTEEFAMADAGNESFDTTQAVRDLLGVTFTAGSGTNRTITIGTLAEYGSISGSDVAGFVLYDAAHVAGASTTYEDAQPCSVARKGFVWATAEDAHVKGQQVFVRYTISGAEVKGAVRTDSDSGDALPLIGAKFASTGSAGLALLELDL